MGFYDEKLKKYGMKRDKNKKAVRILFWGRLLREKKIIGSRGKSLKRRKVSIVIWGTEEIKGRRQEKKKRCFFFIYKFGNKKRKCYYDAYTIVGS